MATLDKQKSELYFLWALLVFGFVLAFFIFKPFLYSLVLALVFAVIFAPLHRRMLKIVRGNRGLGSLLSTILILILVIVPLSFLVTRIFHESSNMYLFLTSDEGSVAVASGAEHILGSLRHFIPVQSELSFDISQYAKQGLGWLIPHLGSVVSNILKMIMALFVFLIALYYLFKDGSKLKKLALAVSPLADNHDEVIFEKLRLAVNTIVRGNLTVAIIQGLLASCGFLLFGVPNAVLWGSITTIAAMIPGFGTTLVIGPAVLYLVLSGNNYSALGLFVWGTMAVGLIDNFLGPKLVERGMHIHPFLILLSILGGFGVFGPLGFIMGPLVLGFLFALLDIYAQIRAEHVAQGSA